MKESPPDLKGFAMFLVGRFMSSSHTTAVWAYVVCAAALAWFVPGASGQMTSEVDVGSRVRVTAPALSLEKEVGVVRGMTGNTVTVDFGEPLGSIPVVKKDLSTMEVSWGQRSRKILGMFLGAAVVGTVGWYTGMAEGDDPPCGTPQAPVPSLCRSQKANQKAWINALAAGSVGGFGGFHIGRLFKKEWWVPTDMGIATASVLPLIGPVGLGLSVGISF